MINEIIRDNVTILDADVSALRMEVKEDKDERKEIIERMDRKEKARDQTMARVIGLENSSTNGITEGTGPRHEVTNQTSSVNIKKTHEQLRQGMKETGRNMSNENQFANNHTGRARTPRHSKTQLVVFGIEEKNIANRAGRKERETKEIKKILKLADKDWNSVGLIDHHRVGKYTRHSTKPRPTKITFDSNERMFNFLTKARNLKDHEEYKHIKIHKHLNKEEIEILREQLKQVQAGNNARSDGEVKEFFWAIRGIRAKKIYIRPAPTPGRE